MAKIIRNFRELRRRLGLIKRKPRRLTPAMKAEIAKRYLAREMTQMELALEFKVSQPTIHRCVTDYEFYEVPKAAAYSRWGRHKPRNNDPRDMASMTSRISALDSSLVADDASTR